MKAKPVFDLARCCVWQTWQRPTLPRLKTKYHGRRGVSRPCSEWERVRPPRHNHQVGKAQHRAKPLERFMPCALNFAGLARLRSWQAFACIFLNTSMVVRIRPKGRSVNPRGLSQQAQSASPVSRQIAKRFALSAPPRSIGPEGPLMRER